MIGRYGPLTDEDHGLYRLIQHTMYHIGLFAIIYHILHTIGLFLFEILCVKILLCIYYTLSIIHIYD